ncbi:MAG TPA: hypothetical protein VNA13_04005 [Xanthomonadales bacterium]|nr:hypothetical protein [Xanthomonadales bacterium]
MSKEQEHTFRQERHAFRNPKEAARASSALERLFAYYIPPDIQHSPPQQSSALTRLYRDVRAYRILDLETDARGIRGEKRKEFIKSGLIYGAVIDIIDPKRAEKDFERLSDGYDMNREYWDRRIELFGYDESV